MQCNVKGDDEALSLTTMRETEWLNHMRQNVEDHQHREREREGERGGGGGRHTEDMQPTVAKQTGNGKAPNKNTTAIVPRFAYHRKRQKREHRHDARVRCCLFLQKLLTL